MSKEARKGVNEPWSKINKKIKAKKNNNNNNNNNSNNNDNNDNNNKNNKNKNKKSSMNTIRTKWALKVTGLAAGVKKVSHWRVTGGYK